MQEKDVKDIVILSFYATLHHSWRIISYFWHFFVKTPKCWQERCIVISFKFNCCHLTRVDRTTCHGVRKRYHPVLQVSLADRELIISLWLYTRARGKQTRLCMIRINVREWCLAEEEITYHTSLLLNTTLTHKQCKSFDTKQLLHKNTFTQTNSDLLSWTTQKGELSATKFIYGILCFAPRGLFFLLFSPSLSYSVQFPAALLSLSFSLLHLSFLTHSLGVRFLQLVHISAPISRTPLLLLFFLSLSLCTPSLLRSLPPPPPLPHADLCLSRLAVGASESREGWVDSHSVM